MHLPVISLRARLFLVLLLPSISAFAAAWWVDSQIGKDAQTDARLQNALKIQSAYSMLLIGVVNAETGVRGYDITGDESYLDPFQQGIQDFERTYQYLKSLPDRPGVDAADGDLRVEEIHDLFHEWLEKIGRPTISARRGGDTNEAERIISSEQGKRYVDRIRELVAQAGQAQHANLQSRLAGQGTVRDRAKRVIWQLPALAMLIAVMLGALLSLSLSNRLRRLAKAANRIAAGELHQRVPVEGQGDVTQLSMAFNRMAEDLERRRQRAEVLERLGQTLHACVSVEETGELVARFASKLFPDHGGALYLASASRNVLQRFAEWGPETPMTAVMAPDDCWALRSGYAHRFGEEESSMPCDHLEEPLPRSSLCIPLQSRDESLGIMHLSTVGEAPLLTRDELLIAGELAERLALAISNLRLREKLRAQSVRDPLTGLYNRRYLEETFERELARCQRSDTSLAVIALDVDHFKRFNDEFGHDAGDNVLTRVGEQLNAITRGSDVACRYGGEEFMLVLPGADSAAAVERAETLRSRIAAQPMRFRGQELGRITISAGVSAYSADTDTAGAMMKRADEALYRAKAEGRDRVILADEPTASKSQRRANR